MGKVIAIVGQIASGKSTLVNYMSKNGFKRITTYTTRKPRMDEPSGIDYYFLTDEWFQRKVDEGFFAETTEYHAEFGFVRYGTSRESLGTPGEISKVIILNPQGVRALKKDGYDIFTVYLDMPQELLMRRALRRGDSPTEIGRRIADDERLFRELESEGFVDLRVTNPELLPNQIAELIRAAL